MVKRRSLLWASLFTVGLCVLLFVLLVATRPAQAQSTPDIPTAPGSIAGIVTAVDGAPLPDIEVRIYQFTSYSNWSWTRTYRTDVQGRYQALALAAGMYRVGFIDPSQRYGAAFYAGALTLGGATPIAVAGTDVTLSDTPLRSAGTVTGLFSDTQWSALDYAYVSALVHEGGTWRPAMQRAIQATGPYSLSGIAPGVYRICAFDYWQDDPLPHPSVCYDDILSSPDYAQAVTVTGNMTTAAIDLNVGVAGDGATIGGLVSGIGGAPLADIEVWLESRAQPPASSISPLRTNAAGRYAMHGVAPGDYALRFVDVGSGIYQTQYFSGVADSEQASILRVERFEERLDVDVTLTPGGVLSGTVRVLGEHPDYAMVIAEPSNLLFPAIPPYTTTEYRNGAYRFTGLPPGHYRLTVYAQLNGISFSGTYGGPAADAAGFITLAPSAILAGLDMNLGAGTYDGEISGRVTAAGMPLAGIAVSVYPYPSGAPVEVESGPALITVPTDAQGRYTIGGLSAGVYSIGFRDPAGVYATQYFSRTVGKGQAERLSLEPVRQVTGIDASLARAGSLSGQVILDNDAPGSFHTIDVYYVEPATGYTTLIDLMLEVNTDANGAFAVQGLLPGVYRVCATTRLFTAYRAGCFGGPLLINDPWQGKDVSVRVGEETAGLDIYLVTALPGQSYLPLLAR